jgi:outer membrane lipoprotein-sorting protein
VIDDVEVYLNGLNTVEANFIQDDITNSILSEGKFYMMRPNKLRIDYKIPNEISLYVNGKVITYYDKELDEISNIPTTSTPLHFLLKENISLNDKNIIVEKVIDNKTNIILTLREKDKEDNGILTILFKKNPISLKSINIKNEVGQEIEMEFLNMEVNKSIKKSIFDFISPRLKRKI